MGWRDRVKKSFADSAYIAEGGKNLKNQENNNKKGLKTTFIPLTHNTQITQNRKDEGEKPKAELAHTTSTVKEQKTPKQTPAQNILAPSPASMGPEYNRVWNQAWELAEWIDDPNGTPIEKRRARLPELDDLRGRMAAIVRQAVPPAGPDLETSPLSAWIPWEAKGAITRDRSPESCPARCKRTGKCYAGAYFEGKAGPAAECTPEDCNW